MFEIRIWKALLFATIAMAPPLTIGQMALFSQVDSSTQIFLPLIQRGPGSEDLAQVISAANAREPELFSEDEETLADDLSPDEGRPEVIRGRRIKVNVDLLGGPGRADQQQRPRNHIALSLFSNRRYVAKLVRTEQLDDGSYAWIGEIPALKFSQVTIIVRDGQATGNVRFPSGLYQIRPAKNGIHAIHEIDSSAFNELEEDTISSPNEIRTVSAADVTAGDDDSIIDVMVVYGPNARAGAGSTAAMESLIDLGFTETNAAYENSGVDFRIRKAHTQEINYTSSGSLSTDIDRLRIPDDGFMDEIHSLRDRHGADLVSLWLEGGGCGIGYIWSNESTAFTVINRRCATGNLTFGHELGHNMGGRHDWYADATIDSATYNHGHVYSTDGWRTLMSYNSSCAVQGINCTRLTQISNPNILISGIPSGVAGNTNTNCVTGDISNATCDAHNAQLFNDRAVIVANFRPSVFEPISTSNHTLTSEPSSTPTSTSTNMPVNTATPIPIDTPTLMPTLTATPIAVSTLAPIVEDFALADIAESGRVRRSYTRTHTDDGSVQSIREALGGTNSINRYNYLAHTWRFDVTGGDRVTFYANASSNQSSDGDTFIFAYSTDNENYTDLLVVSHGDREVLKSAALPNSIRGTVYIRVTDSDQSLGTSARDSVYVDYLSIHSENALTK